MRYRWASPRQALLAFFGDRGPRPARPCYEPRGSTRRYQPHDISQTLEIGIMLGHCGVPRGSPLWESVKRWAQGDEARSWAVEKVERQMRERLRARGLVPPRRGHRMIEAAANDAGIVLHTLVDHDDGDL